MIQPYNPDTYDKVVKLHEDIAATQKQFLHLFMQDMLFTLSWWVQLVMTVIPWIVWWRIHPRRSTARLLFTAFYVIIFACCFDFLGMCIHSPSTSSCTLPHIG